MDIKLAEAFAANKPVRFYAPKSRGAEDFAQLATTLLELMESSD
jgi:chromosome partitioning protein